jgi:c(7)-type cytochrome triheme protein
MKEDDDRMKRTIGSALAVYLLTASAAWSKVGGGDITFSVSGANDAVYSHEFHVTKAGLKCTDCHYKIFKMVEQQKQATMADMQNGKSCGACHNGQKAFTVKENCTKCHR